MFSILIKTPPGRSSSKASIVIGESTEAIEVPTSYWSIDDYFAQWLEALTLVLDEGHPAALVTKMYDPRLANFFEIWPLYPDNNVCHVRNQIVMAKDLGEHFGSTDVARAVLPRRLLNDDGEEISEWTVPLVDIEEFRAGLVKDLSR